VPDIKLEDRLDGTTNFKSWQTRILFFLDENQIQKYVKQNVSELASDEEKAKHKKNEAKTKIILIDSIRDHLIPHIAELKTAKEMYDTLVGLFESKNTSRKLALRNQLRCIMMTMSDSVTNYFLKISQLKNQLQVIGATIDDAGLVTVTLNGLPSSWEPFVHNICG
jgi:hypothetical protein